MNKPVITMPRIILLLWLATLSTCAFAGAPTTAGVFDSILVKFATKTARWATVMETRATWVFWILVLISMVWTFGMMALRRADIGEMFAEFIRFIMFTGFFWWLLDMGAGLPNGIINSMRGVGADAAGTGMGVTPSEIAQLGFNIFFKVIDRTSMWSPIDSTIGFFLSLIILVCFALIAVNMLLLLISAWILGYAGIFILGFGGSKWTSEMAIGYFKSMLNIGLQLMTMTLLIGVGSDFVNEYYAAMETAENNFKQMAVMLGAAIVLLALVSKLPPQVGALAGGSTGSLGSNFGAGTAVAAAAMAGAAVASAGAALAGAATGAAGGAQALMAAVSKANAAESAGGGGGTAAGSSGGGGGGGGGNDSQGGGSSLAAAMGDAGSAASSSSSQSSDTGASGGAGSISGGANASGGTGSSGASGSSGSSGNSGGSGVSGKTVSSGGSGSSGGSSKPGGSTGSGGPAGGGGSTSMAGASSTSGAPSSTDGGATGQNPSAADSASASVTGGGENGDETSGSGSGSADGGGGSGKRGGIIAKAGRIAAGTMANLAQGSYDVAREKMQARLGDTTGGKIAAAIKARQAKEDGTDGDEAEELFDENSRLTGGDPVDAEDEIAAFRDGKNQPS